MSDAACLVANAAKVLLFPETVIAAPVVLASSPNIRGFQTDGAAYGRQHLNA
jgi:hypothetical protein